MMARQDTIVSAPFKDRDGRNLAWRSSGQLLAPHSREHEWSISSGAEKMRDYLIQNAGDAKFPARLSIIWCIAAHGVGVPAHVNRHGAHGNNWQRQSSIRPEKGRSKPSATSMSIRRDGGMAEKVDGLRRM